MGYSLTVAINPDNYLPPHSSLDYSVNVLRRNSSDTDLEEVSSPEQPQHFRVPPLPQQSEQHQKSQQSKSSLPLDARDIVDGLVGNLQLATWPNRRPDHVGSYIIKCGAYNNQISTAVRGMLHAGHAVLRQLQLHNPDRDFSQIFDHSSKAEVQTIYFDIATGSPLVIDTNTLSSSYPQVFCAVPELLGTYGYSNGYCRLCIQENNWAIHVEGSTTVIICPPFSEPPPLPEAPRRNLQRPTWHAHT